MLRLPSGRAAKQGEPVIAVGVWGKGLKGEVSGSQVGKVGGGFKGHHCVCPGVGG